ncbi:MAG: 3-phosphoshikimate 1-carboxyvinyltransferase [Coriobacteriales bacterium]|nr:3-phosphoshikimate 1-carboxyvinyltransferase [Coriobacteriales bacterium]
MSPSALKGHLRVPGDKSLSHRVALFSAMANGRSQVRGLLDSLDVRSTLHAIASLGAKVELNGDKDGRSLVGSITGWGDAGPRSPKHVVDCGNSGTTARLLLGIVSGYDCAVSLVGDASLSGRPMDRVVLPLTQMGAHFYSSASEYDGLSNRGDRDGNGNGGADLIPITNSQEKGLRLPLTAEGSGALRAIDYVSPVASAQVKSAILLAGLNARGTTRVTEPHKSRDHTELLLRAYGASLAVDGLAVSVTGGSRLGAVDCEVPGDPSSAAFLLVAAALVPGSEVRVCGMLLNPTRTGFLTILERMGAEIAIEISKNSSLGGEQVGDVTLRHREGLEAIVVEAHEIGALIDEVPILALLATAAKGTTVFRQVGELRVKESNRLAAIVEGLLALGCTAREEGDDLYVEYGPPRNRGVRLATYSDHRLVMTWAVAARAFDLAPVIAGLESANVSYPGFFDDLRRLS